MIAWHVLKPWLMAWLQGSKLDKDQRMVAMTRFPSCYFENKCNSSGPFPSQNLINKLGKHAIHLRSNLTSHPTLVTHWAYVSRGWYFEEDPLLFVAIKIHIHSNLSRLEYFKSLCQNLWYANTPYPSFAIHLRYMSWDAPQPDQSDPMPVATGPWQHRRGWPRNVHGDQVWPIETTASASAKSAQPATIQRLSSLRLVKVNAADNICTLISIQYIYIAVGIK